jgi:hypothetical protein
MAPKVVARKNSRKRCLQQQEQPDVERTLNPFSLTAFTGRVVAQAGLEPAPLGKSLVLATSSGWLGTPASYVLRKLLGSTVDEVFASESCQKLAFFQLRLAHPGHIFEDRRTLHLQ